MTGSGTVILFFSGVGLITVEEHCQNRSGTEGRAAFVHPISP